MTATGVMAPGYDGALAIAISINPVWEILEYASKTFEVCLRQGSKITEKNRGHRR